MRENETNVPVARKGTSKEQAGDSSGRIVRNLRKHVRNVWDQITAAARHAWMEIHDCLAAIELLEHRPIGGIARAFICLISHKDSSTRREDLPRVRQLPTGNLRLRQRGPSG